MRNVVLGYPILNKSDIDWIQDLRKSHDRLYEVVEPHFTFVFPTEKLSIKELIRHTELKSSNQFKIHISLNKAIVIEDDSKAFFHTFLIPTDGNQEIIDLHDLLYTDELASELRLDITFVPHIGVGTNKSKEAMQHLANTINAKEINTEGSIDSLTVSSFDGKRVNDVKRLELK